MNLLKKVAILFVSFSLVAVGTVSAKDFKPKKPIELIIMAGQGGGADEIARLVQGIAEKNDFTSKPLIPINKPGGSGGEALTYVKGKSGDQHTIMITLNSFFTTPQNQTELGINILDDYTPLARLLTDTFMVWIKKDGAKTSGINTLDEFLARAKQGDLVMGGTGKMSED